MSNQPTITEIRANSKARFKIIDRTEKQLKKKFGGLQRNLYSILLKKIINRLQFDQNGAILDNQANRILILNTPYLDKFFSNTSAPEVINILNTSFKGLDKAAFQKASLFANVNTQKASIQNESKEKLGLKPRNKPVGVYYRKMISDPTQAQKVRSAFIFAINSGKDLKGVKKIIREEVIGTNSKLGVISNFQELEMRSTNATETYDRFIQDKYSDALGLNYAIYQGGEIKSTRDFCEHRNGKVYKREEILSWEDLDWEGKKDNHNIILDAGGYNCRHYYDWISYELAVQLRPNIGRSSLDRVVV